MNELEQMDSENNSLEYIHEIYRKSIIQNYAQRLAELRELAQTGNIGINDIENSRIIFNNEFGNEATEISATNPRWTIVGAKNLFGLSAELFPREENKRGISKEKRLYLRLETGRFQMQKCMPEYFNSTFPNRINISDILERNEGQQFSELDEFYDMNNRQIFEKFGVHMTGLDKGENNDDLTLLAISVMLDSILKDKYQNIKKIFCWSPNGYRVEVDLKDGTKIIANSSEYKYDNEGFKEKGIYIMTPDEKKAMISFNAVSKEGTRITDIGNLDIEDAKITGDVELTSQLQAAMEEQFESQRQSQQIKTQNFKGTEEIKTQDLDEESQATNYDDRMEPSEESMDDVEYDSSYEDYVKSTMIDRQIIAKKIEMALSNQRNNVQNGQVTIDYDEFYIAREMFNEIGLHAPEEFVKNMGTAHSANYKKHPYSNGEPVYVQEYLQIKLSNGNVLSIEFLGKENNGRIAVKSEEERTHNSWAESDIVFKGEGTSMESILAELGNYLVDEASLVQLLEQKLVQLEKESKKYSELEALIEKQTAKEGQNIGE